MRDLPQDAHLSKQADLSCLEHEPAQPAGNQHHAYPVHCIRTLMVERLDALDGTPVIDIKPVMREFLPLGEMHQPAWVSELMKNYWEYKEIQ